MFIYTLHFKAEGGGEVFLVAKHDVDKRRQFPVHLQGSLFPTDGFPERVAVVEIVGDDHTMFACRLHRFVRDPRCSLRESRENAPGVEPAGSLVSKDLVPIDLARFQLRYRGVAAIRATHGRPYTKTSLGEI